jgi:hypothetical protein
VAPAPAQQQVQGDHGAHQGQHRHSAQRGDVAHHQLDRRRPQRVRRVGRIAQRHHHRAVERLELALAHLAGQAEERPRRRGDRHHQQKRRGLEAGKNRGKAHKRLRG